jgi:molybdenum-dependent DNA-binding transcriptional regulator ModE
VLTKFGERLVEAYDSMVERSNRINRKLLDEIGRSSAQPKK